MNQERQTHYTLDGRRVPYDYYTVRAERPEYGGGFVVHAFGEYGRSSVLSGQSMKRSIGHFDTMDEALAMYPEAGDGHDLTDPGNSVSHLPGEDDPVAGGMYPDDIEDRDSAPGCWGEDARFYSGLG